MALREKGRFILAEPDEDKRADLAESLAEEDAIGALDFLLTLLATDPSADVRENIVDELEAVDDPRVDPALEGACSSIPISTSRWRRSSCCARVPPVPFDAPAGTAARRRAEGRPR